MNLEYFQKAIAWPGELGEPKRCEPLSGMGLGKTFLVEFDDSKLILKGSPNGRETQYYKVLAPKLALSSATKSTNGRKK